MLVRVVEQYHGVVVGYYRFCHSVCRRSSRIRVAFFVLEDAEEVVGIKSCRQTKPNFCTLLLGAGCWGY